MTASGGRWNVLLIREGEAQSHRFVLSPLRLLLLGLVVGAGIIGSFAAGRWAASLKTPRRIVELESRIDSLQRETAKVERLAATLTEMERSYDQLRGIMTGEVEPSAGDILLPAVGSAEPSDGGAANRESEIEPGPRLWPLVEPGFITRAFGDTSSIRDGGHVGLDIAVPSGSYIRAAGAGVVDDAGEDAEYGRYVRVAHGDGLRSLYAHASWIFTAEGDSVEAGEVIALSGNTGRSTAPHLHLEIEQDGEPVDPLPWVSGTL
ncbi:MAG: M23 family metallopeptidase [marine benthic group bacterium]|nr:M23 family metallopeptidase [Candidatus Carthagonibacter metallireducens]